MKLTRYSHNGDQHLGVIDDEKVYRIDGVVDNDMAVIAGTWPECRELAVIALGGDGLALDDVKLLAPIAKPEKIMAIGLNYADHIEEAVDAGLDLARPSIQTWFSKQTSSLNGPYDPIEVPKVSPDSLDYEAELVAVIGRGGRHISKHDAPAHIFGYCVGNDVTVREWQLNTSQFVVGKSFDTHAPVGPWITTADELINPHELNISCFVNGDQRQSSNTSHLVFDIWEQIEHISKAMTLKPGDLIFTGTPAGVGYSMSPRCALKDGDVVRVEIEKLGYIENLCVDER